MANEASKDFNAMLQDSKGMPKIQIITDEKSIEKYGGPMAFECEDDTVVLNVIFPRSKAG